ncbi:hypothetical protein BC628DRAFT_223628 [Trametes gibbosa]|nr:hypothetical protein BC628DRAFT_223628 [Trametes gibbosa]
MLKHCTHVLSFYIRHQNICGVMVCVSKGLRALDGRVLRKRAAGGSSDDGTGLDGGGAHIHSAQERRCRLLKLTIQADRASLQSPGHPPPVSVRGYIYRAASKCAVLHRPRLSRCSPCVHDALRHGIQSQIYRQYHGHPCPRAPFLRPIHSR